MAQQQVVQFKITLLHIDPTIWRRIQISDSCSFWDLHVAIQDVMGWMDYHLHEFQVKGSKTKQKEFIGIPNEDDYDVHYILPGWENKVMGYLKNNKEFLYTYDYGDNWRHRIKFEGIHDKQPNQQYPICLGGQRACPPEDVGGIPGYYDFIEAIQDPENENHKSMLDWVGGSYNPNEFDAKNVIFDDPSKRRRENVF